MGSTNYFETTDFVFGGTVHLFTWSHVAHLLTLLTYSQVVAMGGRHVFPKSHDMPLTVAEDGSKDLVTRSLFMSGIDISSSGWFLLNLTLTT
jgi:hypothetical protein